MNRLVSAIPVVAEQTGRPVVLVGGLAVMCRLAAPYRATTDLDTVDRHAVDQDPQLELLVSAGATPSGPSGALVRTSFGDVQVDVLEVTDADLNPLPEDETDRLHVQSHAWAASTATHLVLEVEELPPLTVAVAEPGPLIAMKLQSIMNRGAAKGGRISSTSCGSRSTGAADPPPGTNSSRLTGSCARTPSCMHDDGSTRRRSDR
ncbi:hypothetical protein [Pseudonocardia humida]|uniref:Nucleotidyltransferase-like protein n=1 Tax=Pseudonocardia humida TaxID=2800819 RepID=A0ABT1A3Q0_9PSEU|nr:hypothetical protein [Pseudonocardia humida]MCO1657627.1 hypothetical protein [Pseudonocardia humida]